MTLKIKPIASNQTELHTPSGDVVLFSYQTPVAAQLAEGGFVRTSTKWSKTTSKHINQWLQGAKAREVDQSVLDGMAA
jgi:cytochrome b